jgi:hypothetical protein
MGKGSLIKSKTRVRRRNMSYDFLRLGVSGVASIHNM